MTIEVNIIRIILVNFIRAKKTTPNKITLIIDPFDIETLGILIFVSIMPF